MPRIPDRWLNYSFVGKQIKDTPFIALKVPLHEHFFKDDFPPEQRFSPNDTKTLIPSLSMIIDLTNTDKYYDHKMFDELGIIYKKIYCIGHEIPNLDVIKKFFRVVDEFIEKNKFGNGLIGVHCTHGVNRTGFLICSYMINKFSYTFENAVKEFNQARGHNIERQNYLDRLQLYEKKPLCFIHDESDVDPKQDFNDGLRRKERTKPRHKHRKRFNNVNTELNESTSYINYYRRTDNKLFRGRYQNHFDSCVRRVSYVNSGPKFNHMRQNSRYYYSNNVGSFNPSAVPPYQNIFNNRPKFSRPPPFEYSRRPPHC